MITLTAMNIVRIAKIVALLAFFLPWAAVSCQGVDVATASGIELMQGKMTANPEFERQAAGAFGGGANAGAFEPSVSSSTNVPDLGINIFAIAAFISNRRGYKMIEWEQSRHRRQEIIEIRIALPGFNIQCIIQIRNRVRIKSHEQVLGFGVVKIHAEIHAVRHIKTPHKTAVLVINNQVVFPEHLVLT